MSDAEGSPRPRVSDRPRELCFAGRWRPAVLNPCASAGVQSSRDCTRARGSLRLREPPEGQGAPNLLRPLVSPSQFSLRIILKNNVMSNICFQLARRKQKAKVAHLCPTLRLCDPVARPAPLSVGFSRQAHWSGQPLPSPGHFPNLEI